MSCFGYNQNYFSSLFCEFSFESSVNTSLLDKCIAVVLIFVVVMVIKFESMIVGVEIQSSVFILKNSMIIICLSLFFCLFKIVHIRSWHI